MGKAKRCEAVVTLLGFKFALFRALFVCLFICLFLCCFGLFAEKNTRNRWLVFWEFVCFVWGFVCLFVLFCFLFFLEFAWGGFVCFGLFGAVVFI